MMTWIPHHNLALKVRYVILQSEMSCWTITDKRSAYRGRLAFIFAMDQVVVLAHDAEAAEEGLWGTLCGSQRMHVN